MDAASFWHAWSFTKEHIVVYWTFALIMGHAAPGKSELKLKNVLRVLHNQLVWTQITLWLWLSWGHLEPETRFLPWDFLFKFPFMLLFEHATFFATHYCLHSKWLYKHVHQQHHEWVHPVPYSAIDAHPVEHILGNLVPLLLAPLVCGASLQTARVWTWVATCNAILAHSGDWVGGEHDMHHRFFDCNYGLHGFFFDRLLGTYRAPVKRSA